MLISRARYPVTALGHGVRAGLWLQGCSIRCEGCIAQDTWEPSAESDVPVAEVLGWLADHSGVDGVTISGGEPFDQPEELTQLLQGIREIFPATVDVLSFSGRSAAALKHSFAEQLALLDAVVTGPYRANRPSDHPLKGSNNQELILLTRLGHERYGTLAPAPQRPVQLHVRPDGLTLVGIPSAGVLDAVEAAAARAGLETVLPTWRRETP